MKYFRLGDLLVNAGTITEEQLDEALSLQKGTGKRLGEVLIDNKFITEMQLIEALRMQLGIDFVDLTKLEIPVEMVSLVSKRLARKYDCIPIATKGDELYLAMTDPLNFVAMEEVKTATKKKVIPVIATKEAMQRAISTLYGNEGAKRAIEEMRRDNLDSGDTSSLGNIDIIGENDEGAPAIRLVNSVIERAFLQKASDIHMEPAESGMLIRTRIDGILHIMLTVPKDLQASVTSRMKIMSGIDVTERRIPQDGRAAVRIKGEDVDLRVSTLPTVYGEKIVIRLLTKEQQILSPEGLGFEGENLEKYNHIMKSRQGVILIVGPTGSGKSSTMYAMINHLNTEEVNLVTLEDPVEYNTDGVNQVQINEKVGMTFANGLRSILRQDPDIIAVGEIRDGETGEIAMRSAMTGHLVLSTLHTSDAVSTIDRLVDIGVEPYMISSALQGVISQRLVRRICPNCTEEYEPDAAELESVGMSKDLVGQVKFHRGVGCSDCLETGYAGRVAVFEILEINSAIRLAIHEQKPYEDLMQAVQESGFKSLAQNCRELLLDGVTTTDEMLRTTNVVE